LRNRLAATQGSDIGKVRINPIDEQRYVFIPPGRFSMGCSLNDSECDADEKPLHEVEITVGFWIGQTEVTQAAYESVTKRNPSSYRRPDQPVETVSWDEANSYCQSTGLRLPSEAEWEYAARAGSNEIRYGILDQIAWLETNSRGRPQPVATKLPNRWGLYDMLGNVWEWTADWYAGGYYTSNVSRDPQGPPSSPGHRRVLRGGAWSSHARGVRVSNRDWMGPRNRGNPSFGFRCAGDLRSN